jgi:hypothetical protein
MAYPVLVTGAAGRVGGIGCTVTERKPRGAARLSSRRMIGRGLLIRRVGKQLSFQMPFRNCSGAGTI